MIVTDDADLMERIALYRSHCTRVYGKSTKYCSLDENRFPMEKRFWFQDFDDCGYNFRMTDIQAAVGLVQLAKLDALNQRRVANAARLTQGLHDVPGLTLPRIADGNTHVFHLYPVMIDPDRFGRTKEDFVYEMLHQRGVKIGTHYIPLPLDNRLPQTRLPQRHVPGGRPDRRPLGHAPHPPAPRLPKRSTT